MKYVKFRPTKIMNVSSALLAVLPLSLSVCHAATVLINSSTRNGGFETNTNTTFADMDQWFNNPGVQSTAVRSGLSQTGSWAGIVSLASNPTISTGHLLAAGDAFTLGFGHRDNVATGDPVINWQLFYFSDEGDIGFNAFTSTARVVLASDSVTATSTTYASAVTIRSAGASRSMTSAKRMLGSWMGFSFIGGLCICASRAVRRTARRDGGVPAPATRQRAERASRAAARRGAC